MSSPEIVPYGSWRSPITSEAIVAEAIGLFEILVEGDDIYWIEARPREAGRYVLVRRSADGAIKDVTPPPYSVRSRVHEYGGGAATLHEGAAYFTNFRDQRLHLQRPGSDPVPLTPSHEAGPGEPRWRYADGVVDMARGLWIGVREEHAPDKRVINSLVAFNLSHGGPGRVLAGGYDFYASPCLSPDGTQLAWLSWHHPNMPWSATELWVARLRPDGMLAAPRCVAGGDEESVFQPQWSPDGRLHFVSDRTGWWNLYRCDDRGTPSPLCPKSAEFGQAQWNFGMSRYAFLGPDALVCAYSEAGFDKLAVLDITTGALSPIELGYSHFDYVRARGGRAVCRAGSPTEPTALIEVDPRSGAVEILRRANLAATDPALTRYFSIPRHLPFPTTGGRTAHAHYYAPVNPDHVAPAGDLPPLIVKCHGGPTSAASGTLDLRVQFWTTRGIAVLDVDYGGSTGYGREYRERLRGQWGVVDVEDCVNAARYAFAEGLADGNRAAITGGSAGGYTVLAALSFRDLFKGGASYYGISDIAALARDTHKFEARYLDWLIGPYPEREDLYRERSPLHHAEKLRRPVIFFQGDEDRVVPPNQTEMMVDAMRRNGVPVGYLLFAGEQHGFRRAENIKRALDAELYFYSALVFGTRLGF